MYSCSVGVVNVQPFTASPLTPVDGVHTKVSYPPKLVAIETNSETPPSHEVTLYEDNSKSGFGVTITGTSINSDAQPNSPINVVSGRPEIVVPLAALTK